ncbi:microtubule organization protein AKNA [Stegostoma tigrinum]|uniref:microtubule organization protein AKNA n=1 Tax=Stegostoma tigrinum TaxID=3053191 RepID=UPI00202B4E54|nr:microtubule organization protein AKNA [Stegostoma tigrinum]XP_048414710.1 microtubule organization protein AKNA [Stegostoma tigrinum]XP_059494108.1 microtubule organization protein AKNA [Stegostoma tigrinum]XP_059494109.1 microtubule organization protein AKNA [Stegostoma tigrinum]XP_059494110.1 microtubule organization protein AKNA [Stegostoma tigrinum]
MAVVETQMVSSDLDPDEDLDEQGEDIFSQMDENGIIGLDEINEYYRQYHPRLEDGLETVEEDGEVTELKVFPPHNKLSSPQESLDDESFNISDYQDSDPAFLSMSADEDESLSHLIYESEPQDADGILNVRVSKSHWHPVRDNQLDMTEDEKEQGSFRFPSDVGTSKEEDSFEEYSDLPYDEQIEESNPCPRDSWHRYEVYNKAQSILDRGDDFSVPSIRDHTDKLSDQSDESITYSKTQGKGSSPSAQDCYSEDFEATYSNNVDILDLSHDSKTIGSDGEVRKEKQDNSSFNYSVLHFNQELLRHLSVDDLARSPDLEAETIPESSCTDSVEEPMGRFSGKGKCVGKANQDSGSGNENRKDKRKSELNKAACNKQVEVAHQEKRPPTLGKPLILKDDTMQHSKANRQIKALTPHRTAINLRSSRNNSSKPLSRKITSETSMYGRGRLNYPLPDFSKVEPRVKFPKDEQAYQKPRSKNANVQGKRNDPQFLHHSPAEIVRQVLQSSNECSPITPTPSGLKVLGEFKSPQQATEMVYQLQEDYRRLLTKYAEAENTIDRLRIGAKVNLYADPPKPSQSVQMASLSQGSKVMTFTIPRAQRAEIGPPSNASIQSECPSVTEKGEEMEVASTSRTTLPSTQGPSIVEPTAGECLTWALAQQAEALQKQMDGFEGLLKARKVAPVAQQKALESLKEGQDALERGYLHAREEHRGLQLKDACSNSYIIGEFDPNREVEGNIFRLGMHLEDLKEQIDQRPESHSATEHEPDMSIKPNSWVTPVPVPQTPIPTPLAMAQSPTSAPHRLVDTVQNLKPESAVPSAALQHKKVDVEVSSVSGESEDSDAIPETLKHKTMQLEDNFDQLLEQCKNIKDLPLSLGLERKRENPETPQLPPTAYAQEMGMMDLIQEGGIKTSKDNLDKYSSDTPELNKATIWETTLSNAFKDGFGPRLEQEELLPTDTETGLRTRFPSSKGTSPSQKKDLFCRKGLTYVDGIASPEDMSRKALHQATLISLEERIVSPETDSGFVGSESSRLTPAIQTPEHQPTQNRLQSQRAMSLKSPCQDEKPAKHDPQFQETQHRGIAEHEQPPTPRLNNVIRRDSILQADASRTSSPQQWTGSIMSEFEQETFVSPTESEPDVQNGLSAYAKQRRHRSSLNSSPLTLHPKVHYSSSPLSIHSARDEVIQALEMEVSQLRQRLEETLRKPQRDSEKNPSTRLQGRIDKQHSPWRAARKHTQEHLEKMEDQAWNKSSTSHSNSKSFSQHKSDLEISAESDASSPIPQPVSVSQTSRRSFSRERQKRRPVKVKGPYTGTDYSLFVPLSSMEGSIAGGTFCPYCRQTRAQMTANVTSRSAPISTSSLKMNSCPVCEGSQTCTDQKLEVKAEHAAKEELPKSAGRSHKARKQHSVHIVEPPPMFSYIPTAHYVPYSSQAYYSSPACTYVSPVQSRFYYSPKYKVRESTPTSARKRSKSYRQRPSTTDDISSFNGEAFVLSDLNCSLDQAISAARTIKRTTKKMVRSLSSDLYKAKAIQECHQLLSH